jgi:hypothetical protein
MDRREKKGPMMSPSPSPSDPLSLFLQLRTNNEQVSYHVDQSQLKGLDSRKGFYATNWSLFATFRGCSNLVHFKNQWNRWAYHHQNLYRRVI